MLSGAQCRMARGLLCWSVQELANASGVGSTTIKRVELIDGVLEGAQVRTLQAIAKAFTDTGKVRFDGIDGVFINNRGE
jgi:transcriptional regulator with XRE-family HTH domain